MKLIGKNLMCVLFMSIVFVSSSYALSSGIHADYGSVTHNTPTWQDLSIGGDGYGVSWSTDGGNTYGRFDLVAGQDVKFKIDMHEGNPGTHYANFAKLWIDWDQDHAFDEANENIIFGKRELRLAQGGDLVDSDTQHEFLSDSFTIANNIDFLSIRARVTCSESISGSWSSQWSTTDATFNTNFTSSGNLNQGEYEDWTIDVAPVPEPATMLLFGLGLLGLAGVSRKKL